MEFGPMPVEKAEGAILAHSVPLSDGGRLRKGRALTVEDMAKLRDDGVREVTVARLGEDDVGEDAAADSLAAALVPDPEAACIRLSTATTGRVNLHATGMGVLLYDPVRIHAVNAVDPMLTFAVLPPFAATLDRLLIGTVKVISYGVDRAAVDAAAQHATRAVRVAPVVSRDAVLIETLIDETPGKGEAAMRSRLETLGMRLSDVVRVRHEVGALAEAMSQVSADLILVLTGSATSDPRDVGPEAVRRAGGKVTRFGMPVDPGNLLFLGRLNSRPVIGLPGCARSPALNGADWVLQRIACGLAVGDAEIAAMGVGGLLKESPARGRPREA